MATKREPIEFKPLTGNQVLELDIKPLEYLKTGVERLDRLFLGEGLPSGGIITVAGASGMGKSLSLLSIALALTERYSVLYVSCENSIQIDRDRMKDYSNVYSSKLDNFRYVNASYCQYSFYDVIEGIGNEQFWQKDKVILIDGIESIMDCGAEDGAMYKIGTDMMKWLKTLCETWNVTAIVSWQLTREASGAAVKKIKDINMGHIATSMATIRYSQAVLVVMREKESKLFKMKLLKSRVPAYVERSFTITDNIGTFNLNGDYGLDYDD